MDENTTCRVERIGTEWEALFIIREADNIKQMSLDCCEIDDIDDIDEEGDDARSHPINTYYENEDQGLGSTMGMEFYLAQIQKAARAVIDEARRLESDVECYVEQFLIRLSGYSTESSLLTQDHASTVNGDEIVQEALEVVGAAERLQELVLQFAVSSKKDESNND
jgi:hypothetical protein